MTKFYAKRIYEEAAEDDGYRVFVDRLWPRGVSNERANLDQWAKELAPTTVLRKWFNHEPAKYPEFKKRYLKELEANSELQSNLELWGSKPKITLLFGAKDTTRNEAIVLLEYLKKYD